MPLGSIRAPPRGRHDENTGHLRYLEIKGNGETTSSFPKFEISKLRPAKVLRKSQHNHIRGLSGSPFVFHHVYPIDNDFKRIFYDLTMSKSSVTLPVMIGCVLISSRRRPILTSKFDTGRVKLMFLFLLGANYRFDTAEFLS